MRLKPLHSKPFLSMNLLSHFALFRALVSANRLKTVFSGREEWTYNMTEILVVLQPKNHSSSGAEHGVAPLLRAGESGSTFLFQTPSLNFSQCAD
jgi:hypothetical protein